MISEALERAADRWRRLDRRTKVVIGLALVFVFFRSWLATQSAFGFHRGWNEGHYSLIARGFFEHPLVPKYAGDYVYNVPPLFPYLVATSFAVLGESTFAARLPSILAAGGTIIATYALGRVVYRDANVATLGTVILFVLPYFQLFGGRAQTDMSMLFLFTSSLACIVHGYDRGRTKWLIAGGILFSAGFAAKQPTIILPAIVLVWLVADRRFDRPTIQRTGILVVASAIALVPLFIWFVLNYLRAPVAFVSTWKKELFYRTTPFADIKLLLTVAFPLGITLPVLGVAGVEIAREIRKTYQQVVDGWSSGDGPTVLVWWVVLYGGFVLYRTPQGHLYYTVGLAPPLALLTARQLDRLAPREIPDRFEYGSVLRIAVVAVVIMGGIGGTIVLFELSGEYSVQNHGGSTIARETGGYLVRNASESATILAPNQYRPPIQWYVRSDLPVENVQGYRISTLTSERIRAVKNDSTGPVYVVYVQPDWIRKPEILTNPVYRSPEYEFTFMDIPGRYVNRSDKFAYYLNDRSVVVYRVD